MAQTPSIDPDLLARFLDPDRYPAVYQQFLTLGHLKHYSKGERIFHRGEQSDRLGILLQGSAESELTGEDGSLMVFERMGEGAQLAGGSFIDGEPTPFDVIACEPCQICFLPFKLLRHSPELEKETILYVSVFITKLLRMSAQLHTSAMMLPLSDRLMHRLARLKNQDNQVEITKEKLAAYLSVSKYKITQSLKDLEQQQLIQIRAGVITLLTPPKSQA